MSCKPFPVYSVRFSTIAVIFPVILHRNNEAQLTKIRTLLTVAGVR